MSLATLLREALALGHRGSPELLAGDVLDEEAIGEGITPAAVLVAIVERPEPTVILTLRPETMRKHPGQVSFPGGRIDPGETPVQAALREAHEELGLDPDQLGSPWGAAFGSFVAFAVGAALPVIPYLFGGGTAILLISLGLSLIALFAVGAGVSLLTGRSPLFSGARQLGIGLAAAIVTYLIGSLIGVAA